MSLFLGPSSTHLLQDKWPPSGHCFPLNTNIRAGGDGDREGEQSNSALDQRWTGNPGEQQFYEALPPKRTTVTVVDTEYRCHVVVVVVVGPQA